jgi:hypothetical protein
MGEAYVCKCFDPGGVDGFSVRPFPIKSVVGKPAPTPAAEIARFVDENKLLHPAPWEQTTLGILRRACQRKSNVPFDPVFQVGLIKDTARFAHEGSQLLQESPLFAAFREKLDDIHEGVQWKDPSDRVAAAERAKAERVLGSLPSLAEIEGQVMEVKRVWHEKLRLRHVPVGWLVREKDQWNVRGLTGLAPGADLRVICPDEANPAESSWMKIGTASDNQLEADSAPARAWVQGRLVFAVAESAAAAP